MNLLEKIQESVPKHKTKIPSSGKVTFFRPFLMREQKVLLIAQQASKRGKTFIPQTLSLKPFSSNTAFRVISRPTEADGKEDVRMLEQQ